MICFPRGSEWRKWDLHVHTPDTKLSNGYDRKDGKLDWDRFCLLINESDVFGIGITDYFTIDGFFSFKERYQNLYPNCKKVFFPNLELRLNEAVNGATEVVDFHIIFRPDLTREQADKFLTFLKTEMTDSTQKHLSCSDLRKESDFQQVTVSRVNIESALDNTFGKVWRDNVILIAANSIRADNKSKRKMNLSDQIDKFADAFFGNPQSVDYFLRSDRYEDSGQRSLPKPVYSGCDAHNFRDLESWLGNEISDQKNSKYITWIKADLSFEGLQQTLIEPDERVRIQSTIPDEKEPYRVISRIVFDDPDFPDEVLFNPGLNAIIGSRSTGKSALLAYIAYAVNPEYTVEQQIAVTGDKESEVGPGASITWDSVKDLKYEVEWAAPTVTEGQVIYIPQNSLFAISERPDEITEKIMPIVFQKDPLFKSRFDLALSNIEHKNTAIQNAIKEWFSLESDVKKHLEDIRNLGDGNAIKERADELSEQVSALRKSSTLSDEEVKLFQKLAGEILSNEEELGKIEQERIDLSPYIIFNKDTSNYEITDQVRTEVTIEPSPEKMPSELREELQSLIDITNTSLLRDISSITKSYYMKLDVKCLGLTESNKKINSENKELIEKNLANGQISSLLKAMDEQNSILLRIEQKNATVKEKLDKQNGLLLSIKDNIQARNNLLDSLTTKFNDDKYTVENVSLFMEAGYDSNYIERISQGFNKTVNSQFINRGLIDLSNVLSNLDLFIHSMANGKQKLNRAHNPTTLTKDVLTITKEIRFVAEMEGDRIGGFSKSSMTPGKQALFALTLILADSDEKWPLLIDQPEDDLDSRSICEAIVTDLMKRKRERQIIMVTHDANLAIGADSEEIIVANRHGDDRPNLDGKMFSYLTGSLEHSQLPNSTVKVVLHSQGVREHACDILDGGADAFQKRKNKYRI